MNQRTGVFFLLLVVLVLASAGSLAIFLYKKGVKDGWMTKRVFLLMTAITVTCAGLIFAIFFSVTVKGVSFGFMLIFVCLAVIFSVLGMYIGLSIPGFWKLPK